MASTDVLSQTLGSITNIKLEEISTQQAEFEVAKSEILNSVTSQSDQVERVRVLLQGVRRLTNIGKLKESPSLPLQNIQQFLEQAHHDPSVSTKILKDWQSNLEKQLDIHSLKYKYATLYSQLVKEWLYGNSKNSTGSDEMIADDGFETIGRKEMQDQRIHWEELVFNEKTTNQVAIQAYLEKLFTSSKDIKAALERLRKATQDFEKSLAGAVHFDEASLAWVIRGLLRSDLVTDEKRQVLKDFLNNKIVLGEVADVLNMRMSSLAKWKWDPSGTNIEQRRNLNGRYRFYSDEDLLQQILLRYIGVKWGVYFKSVLSAFRHTLNVWTPSAQSIPNLDRKRRDFFLYPDREYVEMTVEGQRSKHFEDEIFLEQLPDEVAEERGGYSDEEAKATDTRKSGQEITQTLLHVLATEIIMSTRLGEDVTVVRTDFAWFGPSLPHATMFAVLKFLGVSDFWLSFFRRAIEAPVKFLVDGPDAPVRTRKRGTPVSGPLSDFLAETVLFCLDFAFNQSTGGLTLYRLHDDIWTFGAEEKCVKGWASLTQFSKLMGLDFSPEKTGCAKVSHAKGGSASIHSSLPKGDVKWGLLKLDATTGRFLINQKLVDEHIEELRRQLENCKSVLDWIQAWNVYTRFFTTNFGKPVAAYGLAHVDQLLETFARIQGKLFSSTGGSVTSTVKKMIQERFGVDDIPEGYLFFPLSMGGLDLKSPFVSLYLIRGQITKQPNSYMDDFFREEERAYTIAKSRFEQPDNHRRSITSYKDLSSETFMNFEEFTRYRLQTSAKLYDAYTQLLVVPKEADVVITAGIAGVLDDGEKPTSNTARRSRGACRQTTDDSWSRLNPYQRWIIALYSSDMIERFGGLNVVEKGLLPTGLVTMFRESRFKWQG